MLLRNQEIFGTKLRRKVGKGKYYRLLYSRITAIIPDFANEDLRTGMIGVKIENFVLNAVLIKKYNAVVGVFTNNLCFPTCFLLVKKLAKAV